MNNYSPEARQTRECKTPLEALYQKMNCGICREEIIMILLHNKVLSDVILQEIKFDANGEVRKLYKPAKK
jgi:hypothetical protein